MNNIDIRSWGRIAPLLSAMSVPTRRHHGNGVITRLTIVGLVAGLIALGALVACPTEEDESESSDASLSALTLSDDTTDVPLMPTFASNTTDYTASVVSTVVSVTVTATPTVGASTVSIMPIDAETDTDGHQVSLREGDTDIIIVVTAADNSTMEEYTITVTRSATASDTTAPTFTVVPADTATDVAVDADIVITANESIRMTDGAEITDGTVAGLITLMETPSGSSTAADKSFTATINAAKRILTIDPTDDFASEASVSVSLAQVEDAAGNDSENPAIAATFTVVPTTIDISGRTQAVRDAILATSQVTETDATAIPSPQLAAITSLTVSGLSSLMADDFANLSGLTTLNLGGNSGLTTLPSSIFDALLDTLTTLTLDTALQGTVDFATASGDIVQGDTVALSVTLTTALPTEVQIPYVVTFANSADAADFSGLADGMVTFAAGSMAAQSISVTATATADVGGTATLTLGTPILTADTRDPSPLAASSLVSVGSTASHTLTVEGRPGATLSVTDDSVTEEAADETPGREAVFILALTHLPTDGVDDVSVFFTVSGFADGTTIGDDDSFVTHLHTIATTTGSDVEVGPRDLDGTTGAGRIELNQPDGSDDDIATDGRSTAEFQIRLPIDDGNLDDETITLTIDCVARSRTGAGLAGCTSAGAGTILVAGSAVGGNGAEITVTDDLPMATLSVTDGSVTEEAADGTPGREAKITLALTSLPTSGADDVSIFFTVSGFIPPIRSDSNAVTRFNAIASTTGFAENIMPTTNENTGAGLVAINRADGGSTADMDIAIDGSATVEFLIRLQKDDGNEVDETITLTIDCVARSRTGAGLAGCTSAGAGAILVAGSAVGDNGAGITVTDDDAPMATLSVTDGILDELAASEESGREAKFQVALINLPPDGADDISIFYTVAGFTGAIGNDISDVTRFGAIASTTGSAVDIMSSTNASGVGRVAINRADGGNAADMDIDGAGSATVEFLLMLQMDDGNSAHETITLTIDCVARSRTGQGEAGCTSAGAGTILIAGSAVVGNGASIVGVDNTPFQRIPSREFNTLDAENDAPRGIWFDDTTMWVADSAADKIFAYNLTSKARDSSKDFNTLSAEGNNAPRGLWSDGTTTMWVANDGAGVNNRIFAYNLTSKARDASKEFDTLSVAGNNAPEGLWSNDTTMWVANDGSGALEKIFAYNLTSEVRDASEEFDTLNAMGNNAPKGIWSNGTTIWVANDGGGANNKIYAYNLNSKARDSDKEFNTLSAASNINPSGIWSDGTTMWVTNSGSTVPDKIFAYRMPPTEE